MSLDKKEIYASPPFKFIVNGEPLYIHAKLASRLSRPFDCLINGDMSEAKHGFATISDFDEDTFARFIQWAYSGYYTAAESKLDPNPHNISGHREHDTTDSGTKNLLLRGLVPPLEEESAPVVPDEPPNDDAPQLERPVPIDDAHQFEWPNPIDDAHQFEWPNPSKPRKGRQKHSSYKSGLFYPDNANVSSSGQALKLSFIRRKDMVRQSSIVIPPPRPNKESNEDYTDVFLSHARLYVLAEKYDIQSLKSLALEELHAVLAIFELHKERTGDIVELLRYIYANTRETMEGSEDMRELLTHYIGYEMDTLMKDCRFRDLMIEDGGDLLDDFMKMVGKRI